MLDTAKKKSSAKRRGNADKYRDYMRLYMREWRARQKVKVPEEKELPNESS